MGLRTYVFFNTRTIQIQELNIDPIELPLNRIIKISCVQPFTPIPVLHSSNRKKYKSNFPIWYIPPSISNWKNQKGYVIQLEKRMFVDGRSLQDTYINENFAVFCESLYLAEKTCTEERKLTDKLKSSISRNHFEKADSQIRNVALDIRKNNLKTSAPKHKSYKSAELEIEKRNLIRKIKKSERDRTRRIESKVR